MKTLNMIPAWCFWPTPTESIPASGIIQWRDAEPDVRSGSQRKLVSFWLQFGYPWPALAMHHVLNENYGMCLGSNTSVLYTRSAMLLLSGLQRPCAFVSLWLPPKAANVGISEFLWIYLQCPNYIVFTNKLVLLSQEISETFGHLLCQRIPCWPISELGQLYEEHWNDKSANVPSQSSGASLLSIAFFFNVIKQRVNSGPMRIHYYGKKSITVGWMIFLFFYLMHSFHIFLMGS